ncbi:hypothetical protein GCM10028864_38710 [Microlunatus parietis]
MVCDQEALNAVLAGDWESYLAHRLGRLAPRTDPAADPCRHSDRWAARSDRHRSRNKINLNLPTWRAWIRGFPTREV